MPARIMRRALSAILFVGHTMTTTATTPADSSTAHVNVTTAPAGTPQTRPWASDDHVVPAPISRRVNTVLSNLIQDCPIMNGTWDRRQGDPGCVELYSTFFGYRAGLRRGREDLIAIGRTTADNEFKNLVKLTARLLPGRGGVDVYQLAGTPAIMVAGALGGDRPRYALFMTVLEWFIVNVDERSLSDVQAVGCAYLLAEAYRFDSRPKQLWLERARALGGRLVPPEGVGQRIHRINFAAFVWSSIARASGDPDDLRRAKDLVLQAAPRFTSQQGRLHFEGPYADVLSLHLTLADACADLATIDSDPRWRPMLVQLVKYVFSDVYFNGKVLVHDISPDGEVQAPDFCTGCNYHALCLADRLYGDALRFDPVPPLRVLRGPLGIISAHYGREQQWTDVTEAVTRHVRDGHLAIRVNNQLAGDAGQDDQRSLYVEYEIAGERRTQYAVDSETLVIP
ncbi:MAG: hypothetical protein AMXMBFR13_38970 [Phycisphaerae bacterium]